MRPPLIPATILAIVALVMMPARIQATSAAGTCGELCAQSWQLDTSASDNPATAIDAALAGYKEEKLRKPHRPTSDLAAVARAEMEDSLGPIQLRPRREELHKELTVHLVVPATLRLSVIGDDILLDEARGAPRRFTPGEPHARVDSLGTAHIKASWSHNSLVIREDYRHSLSNRETYAVDKRGELLTVTRVLERPAMPDITLRSVYRRAAT